MDIASGIGVIGINFNGVFWVSYILYFFGYEFFSLPKQSKNLDPFYKMDLDLWDCLGRVKLVLWQHCIRLI